MITSTQIGRNGRLGNQIFQFATLHSVGFTRGIETCIPSKQDLSSTFKMEGINVKDVEISDIAMKYQERTNEFDPSVFLSQDHTDIEGYFQSGMYFSQNLRQILTFKDEINSEADSKLSHFAGSPLCSIHIRRGDYLRLSHFHKNLESDYYNKAIQLVMSNIPGARFIVFSDDPVWCRENLPDEITVDDSSQEVSLCMMSKCPIHVIANSSFSWWGAWLSGSRAVIAPNQWFSQAGPRTWSTIYEPHWVRI